MSDTIISHSHIQQVKEKPLLIIHRIPSYTCFFHHRLAPNFTLLEPFDAVGADSSAIQSYLRTNGSGARALVCVWASPLRKDILDCLPSLELVVVACAGYNHIDLSECRRRGILVANVGDVSSEDVADYTVGMLLDVLRKFSAADRYVRGGVWPRPGEFPLGSSMRGKRIGIVGLGSIGTFVANRLIPFGCTIAYNSRQKKSSVSFPYYANVYDLALDSDILILCCSLTDQTHHIIDKKVLTALGKDGYVINVGRGALINENELVQSLVEGEIGGAGLDVFEYEPNISKELFGLDNVVLSPHRAAFTPQSFKAVEDIVVANLEAFFSNKPLITPIRLE
ncbi:glyoxylate/hydroxypyruvate reductase HPR3-like [Chenopodium quinoa]|uniref:glyoxylate/hydroxypyruvate reductase HPR3-like n=1 Tax=Chenopodium quinoa TaxID=63459 RepID=UPI000B79356F|nr:glyoxylate/hydroxypyruvate reductase HPR3-like [Chenopodium quinoa]